VQQRSNSASTGRSEPSVSTAPRRCHWPAGRRYRQDDRDSTAHSMSVQRAGPLPDHLAVTGDGRPCSRRPPGWTATSPGLRPAPRRPIVSAASGETPSGSPKARPAPTRPSQATAPAFPTIPISGEQLTQQVRIVPSDDHPAGLAPARSAAQACSPTDPGRERKGSAGAVEISFRRRRFTWP
jgi:hypothetical protein